MNTPTMTELIDHGLSFIKSSENETGDIELNIEGKYGNSIFLTIDQPNMVINTDYKKIIKASERLIRSSSEYKMWLSNLRSGCGMNKCSFLNNIDMTEETQLEFHHTPLTLYDIVDIVMSHLLYNRIPVTTTVLADLVIDDHLNGIIGMMPVSVTAHKMLHTEALFENSKMIHGNWVTFLKKYKDGVLSEHLYKCLTVLTRSDEYVYNKALETLGSDSVPRFSKYTIPVFELGYMDYIQNQIKALTHSGL